MSKHDDKRELVEHLLDSSYTVPEMAQVTGIPAGSFGYLLKKWGLLDRQVRRTTWFSNDGKRNVAEAQRKRHVEHPMTGDSHWSYGLLKLHGEFVPEEEARAVLGEMLEQDLTTEVMAAECQVDRKTITNWLTRFGLHKGIRSGKRCSWYKGGWIKERGPDWLTVRKRVLERDGYKCTKCGMTQEEARQGGHCLNVHHKVPWRETHDNSDENLETLCQSCHMITEWESGCWSDTA